MSTNSRLVYSTDTDRNQTCPKCRQLQGECTCATAEAVPARVVVKLRLEKGGRGGKSVTVLYDLPRNPTFLKELAGRLKRQLGTGGTARENTIEIQGDYRERLRPLLTSLGYQVKG